jgi:hypothetical protein
VKFSHEEYKVVLSNAKRIYSKIGKVSCPALNDKYIHFNSEGFNHILYKGKRKERSKQDQFMRLKSIGIASEIVKIATTYQEYDERIELVLVNSGGRKKWAHKIVKYWKLVAILHRKRFSVIIRKVGEGNYHFWSLIPDWLTTKHGDIVFRSYSTGALDIE